MSAWHLYDVAVDGYGTEILTGPSRGRVMADAWRSDPFSHLSFRDFMRICHVKKRADPIPNDGYGYVRQRYEVDPKVGQRVAILAGSGSQGGRQGIVLYPGRATAAVHVLIDGADRRSIFHPSDVVFPLPSSTVEAGR